MPYTIYKTGEMTEDVKLATDAELTGKTNVIPYIDYSDSFVYYSLGSSAKLSECSWTQGSAQAFMTQLKTSLRGSDGLVYKTIYRTTIRIHEDFEDDRWFRIDKTVPGVVRSVQITVASEYNKSLANSSAAPRFVYVADYDESAKETTLYVGQDEPSSDVMSAIDVLVISST